MENNKVKEVLNTNNNESGKDLDSNNRSPHVRTGEPINRVKELIVMALFVAIDIALGQVLAPIKLPTMKISFGFISILITGMYLGPMRAAAVGVISDIVATFLGLIGGVYFPGFTLSAFLNGLCAGYFLEGKKSAKASNVIMWAVISSLFIALVLNSIWIPAMANKLSVKAFFASMATRTPNNIGIMIAKILVVPIVYTQIFRRLRLRGVERPGIR